MPAHAFSILRKTALPTLAFAACIHSPPSFGSASDVDIGAARFTAVRCFPDRTSLPARMPGERLKTHGYRNLMKSYQSILDTHIIW